MSSFSRVLMLFCVTLFGLVLAGCVSLPINREAQANRAIAEWTPVAEPSLTPTIIPSPFPSPEVELSDSSSSVVAHLAENRRPTPIVTVDVASLLSPPIQDTVFTNITGGFSITIPAGLSGVNIDATITLSNAGEPDMLAEIVTGAATIPEEVDPDFILSEVVDIFVTDQYDAEDPLPIDINGARGVLIYQTDLTSNEDMRGATAVFHNGKKVGYVVGNAVEDYWDDSFEKMYLKTLVSFVMLDEELETP